MNFLLSDGRKRLLRELGEHYDAQHRIISRVGHVHDGRRPPYFYEALVEVCSILLLIGDAFGYIAVDDDGVVDPLRSFAPFLENFVFCVEVTHTWCIRHPPFGRTPVDRRWCTTGLHGKVMLSPTPLLQLKMIDAVYPHVLTESVIPGGTLLASDSLLRRSFLQSSRTLLSLAEQGSYRQSEPLCPLSNIHSVGMYINTVRVVFADTLENGEETYVSGYKNILSLKMVEACHASQLCEGKIELQSSVPTGLYVSLQALRSHQTVYDKLKSILTSSGQLVSYWSLNMNI